VLHDAPASICRGPLRGQRFRQDFGQPLALPAQIEHGHNLPEPAQRHRSQGKQIPPGSAVRGHHGVAWRRFQAEAEWVGPADVACEEMVQQGVL
jgi:hypothetical protein